MCRRREVLPILILAVALVAAAAPLAAEAPACAPVQASGASGALGGPGSFVAVASGKGSIDGPAEQAVCNAQCNDGSYVTCWGTTCSATDASCPAQRGYCWGAATGYRYCPACPPSCGAPCWAEAVCNDGSRVSCDGCSGDCFAIDGCYAYCDGQWNMCPNPPPDCPI